MKLLNFPSTYDGPTSLESERLYLRRPEPKDFAAWRALRLQSADFLQPFEPKWGRDELSRTTWLAHMRRQHSDIRAGRALPWFLFLHDDVLVGGLTLNNIRRGISHCATLGYWMGQPYAGQGLMSEAVGRVCADSFARLALNRIEAAIVPENDASRCVLLRNRFQQEGLARSYLCIGGQWRDHHLFARLASD